MTGRALVLAGLVLAFAASAEAQAPREAPLQGYQFHDERTSGPFTVQRWVSAVSPQVAASGLCECITVVYSGTRRVLTLGIQGGVAATSIVEPTGRDINGDGHPDLVVSEHSGGEQCCHSTLVYSIGEETRPLLTLAAGRCGTGEFSDLDGDGRLEVLTCDQRWASAYCSLEDSPFPTIVMAYDAGSRQYVPATPRYARYLRDRLAGVLEEAQKRLADEPEAVDKCTVLRPALGLMYSGRIDDGRVLVRTLYRGPDRDDFEQEIVDRVRRSPLWVAR